MSKKNDKNVDSNLPALRTVQVNELEITDLKKNESLLLAEESLANTREINTEMSDQNRVTQVGNRAEGDIAGRDINKPTVNVEISQAPSAIKKAADKVILDNKNNPRFDEFIDRLKRYTEFYGNVTRDLDQKLKEGGREHDIPRASKQKHYFTMMLNKYSLHLSAQELFAVILADLYNYFETIIKPDLTTLSETKINEKLYAKIESLHSEVSDGAIIFTTDDIYGMIYYLTGNCHVEWV